MYVSQRQYISRVLRSLALQQPSVIDINHCHAQLFVGVVKYIGTYHLLNAYQTFPLTVISTCAYLLTRFYGTLNNDLFPHYYNRCWWVCNSWPECLWWECRLYQYHRKLHMLLSQWLLWWWTWMSWYIINNKTRCISTCPCTCTLAYVTEWTCTHVVYTYSFWLLNSHQGKSYI